MISNSTYNEYWRAHRGWLDQFPAQIIFTGHVQLGKSHSDSAGNSFYEGITVEKLDKYIGYFIKKLSRSYFGTKAVNGGRLLGYMGRIEGGLNPNVTGEPRLHVHMGLTGYPDGAEMTDHCEKISEVWENGEWGYRDTLAEPCYGEAWKNYILKNISPYSGERFITNVPYREPN